MWRLGLGIFSTAATTAIISPIRTAAAAAASPSCSNATFPVSLAGKRAFGIAAHPGASSADECVAACCAAGAGCTAWQWSRQPPAPTAGVGSPHPITGIGVGSWRPPWSVCFIGVPTVVKDCPNDYFVGGLEAPLPPPPPGPPARPSADQLKWLDLELGTFFHYTMYTFVSQPNSVDGPHEDCGQVFNSNLTEMPAPSTFNPERLSVDQWMQASRDFGAKYAILVTKHGDGFINFQTNVTFDDGSPYGYGVQQSSWRNGSGDLLMDFVTSARKHGISPGVYYSLPSNFYLPVDTNGTTKGQRPVSRKEYYRIVLAHLEEVWGGYGPLGEVS